MEKEDKRNSWKWWKILLIILFLLWLLDNWREDNCDLKFETYTYSTSCYGACETKCNDEGFDYYQGVEAYTNYVDWESERRICDCLCEGCR